MTIIKNAVLAVLLALGMVAAASSPAAGSERISRGDAQAVFSAFWTSFTIKSFTPTTAPGLANGSTIFLNSIDDDGGHVCTLDWHTYGVGWGLLGTQQDARADKALLDIDFLIDGQPVESNVSAIRRANTDFGLVWGWFYGGLIAPGSLSIGAHTLTTDFNYDGTFESLTVTFFVDAAGTGECL